MQRSGGGDVLQIETQLPPPADAGRSATEEPTGRVRRIVVAILFAITAASIVAFTFREGPLDAEIRKHQLVVDGATRDYRIVVPHETVRPTPVVFAFHGVGDSTDSMAD